MPGSISFSFGEIMILKQDSTKQKLRGAYYTPKKAASKMVEFFKEDASIQTVLEPSCGGGVFIDTVLEHGILKEGGMLTAIEIEADVVQKTIGRVGQHPNVRLLAMDFFQYYQEKKDTQRFDLIVGNPPYIRYQYLEDAQRAMMSQILKSHGMKANKLINTWVGFLVACVIC